MGSCLIRERSSTLAKGQEGRRRRRIAGVTHQGKGRRHAFDACHVHISERTTTRHSFSLFLPPPPLDKLSIKFVAPSHRFSSRPPCPFSRDNRPPENDIRPAISYFVQREHDRRWIILRLIVGRYFVSWIVEIESWRYHRWQVESKYQYIWIKRFIRWIYRTFEYSNNSSFVKRNFNSGMSW